MIPEFESKDNQQLSGYRVTIPTHRVIDGQQEETLDDLYRLQRNPDGTYDAVSPRTGHQHTLASGSMLLFIRKAAPGGYQNGDLIVSHELWQSETRTGRAFADVI